MGVSDGIPVVGYRVGLLEGFAVGLMLGTTVVGEVDGVLVAQKT